ncbi:hypothetical protein [Microbacterium sp. cf332]|uniref:DUF6966 domain-containing protein n=1 Tax=Microbacterium sp. cf332 TaxID=1761804 RepID=UPI000888CB25|nr:hypothetical protein [Microbacterium sp. cf332]SDQ75759.1 hypothetical protein SAMN04487847_2380 [Microbacterium sp. cf332]
MGEPDLRAALEELASLLRSVGADPWAEWASRSADHVAAGGDPTAIRRAFGGMGSLNDLVIHPINGHRVASSQVAEANERLSLLRQRIFAAATRAE